MLSQTKIKAEMARRGLLSNQRASYEDAERGYIDPKKDPEIAEGAWEFLWWLEQELER